MCYPLGEFRIGQNDIHLGDIEGCPFYMGAEQFEYWRHTHLIIDAVPGRGGGFSLEAPEGMRFLTRSRLLSEEELNELAKRNILDKVYILIGITPIKSLKMGLYMHNEVPGVLIPEALLKRIEVAGENAEEEGVQITLELIEKIRGKQGIHGFHIMAVGWEEIVPRIIQEAGLLPKDFTGAPAAEVVKVKATTAG